MNINGAVSMSRRPHFWNWKSTISYQMFAEYLSRYKDVFRFRAPCWGDVSLLTCWRECTHTGFPFFSDMRKTSQTRIVYGHVTTPYILMADHKLHPYNIVFHPSGFTLISAQPDSLQYIMDATYNNEYQKQNAGNDQTPKRSEDTRSLNDLLKCSRCKHFCWEVAEHFLHTYLSNTFSIVLNRVRDGIITDSYELSPREEFYASLFRSFESPGFWLDTQSSPTAICPVRWQVVEGNEWACMYQKVLRTQL